MSFAISFSTIRAFALGLVLLGPDLAQAQKTSVKAESGKAKTKPIGASGTVSGPHPVSPLTSAPQVVLPAAAANASALTGWLTDLDAAKAQARASNRPILAVFSGSDWCKPCITYEQEVFAKPEFTAYAQDKLVLAHFDFPRQKRNQPAAAQLKLNETAAAQLNREGDFPLAVVLSPEGKVLAKTGYIAGGPAAFQAYLKKVVPTL
ncbi:MAG TPA: thioredoxin family protein [Hymenobacter sp.]